MCVRERMMGVKLGWRKFVFARNMYRNISYIRSLISSKFIFPHHSKNYCCKKQFNLTLYPKNRKHVFSIKVNKFIVIDATWFFFDIFNWSEIFNWIWSALQILFTNDPCSNWNITLNNEHPKKEMYAFPKGEKKLI